MSKIIIDNKTTVLDHSVILGLVNKVVQAHYWDLINAMVNGGCSSGKGTSRFPLENSEIIVEMELVQSDIDVVDLQIVISEEESKDV